MSNLVIGSDYSRVYFSAVVDTMFIGVLRREVEFYAGIDLIYPESVEAQMVRIAKEMQRLGQSPQTCMLASGRGVDIVVLFWLRGVGFEFLKALLPAEIMRNASTDLLADKMEIVTTGESEFGYEAIGPFLDCFQETGKFRVSIARPVDEQNNEILWSVELSALLPALPAELASGH